MKVLLVYPEFPDTFWSFKHALPFFGKRSVFPPLGLLTVSALMPANWQRRVVDLNVRRLSDAELAWADMVFFSAMIIQGSSLRQQIARCKALGLRTVVGGPITSSKDSAFAEADHVVEGEAEELIPRLCADLEARAAEPHYASRQWPDVTKVPLPHFHLADLRRYSSMAVQFSRGCPSPANSVTSSRFTVAGRVPKPLNRCSPSWMRSIAWVSGEGFSSSMTTSSAIRRM